MKRSLLILMCGATLLAGCQQAAPQSTEQVPTPSEATPQQKQLAKSLETWNALKAEQGNHYRYEVSAGSVFGPGYDTTLTVQEGVVVQRDLATSEIDDEGNVTTTQVWSETGAALGSHDEGAELITIDERYNRCRNDVLSRNSLNNDVTLEFQDKGVLASCYAIPKNVAYDGGAEVITNLEFLNRRARTEKGDALKPSPFC